MDGNHEKSLNNTALDILYVINKINKELLQQNDSKSLINDTCRLLVEDCGFDNAWIVLSDENYSVESIINKEFSPYCTDLACYRTENIEPCEPPCECLCCSAAFPEEDDSTLSICLKHKESVLGYLNASKKTETIREEDQLLFSYIADGVSLAIWSINNEKNFYLLEQKYTELLAITNDAIIIFDEKGIIISLNKGAEQFLKCKQGNLIGESIIIFCPEKKHEEWIGIKQLVLDTEQVIDFNTECLTADGVSISIKITIQRQIVEKDKPIVFTAIVQHLSSIIIPLSS